MDPITTAPVSAGAQLSIWHLVAQASWPVLLVMIGLALASIWSWAIIFEKFYAVRRMNAANDKFESTVRTNSVVSKSFIFSSQAYA